MKKAEDNGGRRNAFVGVRDEKMKVYCKQGTSKYILLALCVVFSICIFISLALTPTASATLYYVNPGESIQAAVDNASDGDTITVRDGTYNENINVNKQVTIKSENGSENCIIQGADLGNSVFEVTANYVTIIGFTVKGTTAAYTAGIWLKNATHCEIANNIASENSNGIILDSSKKNRVHNSTADSNHYHGIELRSASENTVEYNTVSNNGENASNNVKYNGIMLNASDNNEILNNVANYNHCHGIGLFTSSGNNTIANNTVKNNGQNGIRLKASNDNRIIDNNASNNNYNGISLNASDNNEILNNVAYYNHYHGIGLFTPSGNNTIANNTVKNNGQNGIRLKASNDNRIIDNNASNNKKYNGITLNASDNNEILNNVAYYNHCQGIGLFTSSDNNTIANNKVKNNGNNGIRLKASNDNRIIDNNASNNFNYSGISLNASDNNEILDNVAYYNHYHGIGLFTSSDNNTIANNKVKNNGNNGIRLKASNDNRIINNIASNNTNGICLWSSLKNAVINNTASSNSWDGIVILVSSDYNTISNNNASLNKYYGIFLVSSNYNIVTNNDLFSNSLGLVLTTFEFEDGTNSNNNQITNNNANFNKYCGIFLCNPQQFNTITNNNASNNNLFGIFVYNSTNQAISNNTANLNDRGIGLHESRDIKLINNTAIANKISGFSLINSTNNTLLNNSASFNTYEGIFLSNSNRNTIANNKVSFNYFGISLYSSNDNNITDNSAESNYYFEVLLHSSSGNDIINNTWYIQADIVYGISLDVLEAITPSLQTAEDGINASYYIVAENLGNSPDTFDLVLSCADNPEISSLDTDSIFLGAGEKSINRTITEVDLTDEKTPLDEEISTNTTTNVTLIKPSLKTITLNVGDTKPGIYTVKVEIISRHDNTVKDVIETRTLVPGEVDSDPIISSKISKSAIIKSSIANATINISAIKNSIINNASTITGSIVNNCRVDNTSLNDVIVEDARIVSGIIRSGSITINEIKYEISNETRISDLIYGSDHRDSNLVGIKNEKTLKVPAENTNVSFDISAKKDYFAGSLSVQKSSIPPDDIPECGNNVGGYVSANASDNLANSTDWLRIYIYYDPNELGDLNERSLRLRYFNKTADAPGWEYIPISGINPIENYVWGDIPHYSHFVLSCQPSPPGPEDTDGGGDWIRHLPEEITLLIANLGINIFNFEWLGHDITKISIDLESMKINAKVALKKVDKPAEFPDPPGIVYGYFDISTNIEPEKIRASKVHFKILKSWTVVNDINVETIKLWRYTNDWEELETAKIKEDDNYLHFCAETKCFSLIAITSEKRALDVTPTAPTPTAPTPTAPAPTPPSESPVPSPPVHPAPVSLTGKLIIIVAIVASAISVSVTYLVLRRRKA